MHGDTPYQSARRAWSLLTILLPKLRDYVRDPTAREDQGRDFSGLVADIDDVLERLVAAEDLLTGLDHEPPPSALLAVVKDGEKIATIVQVRTFIENVDNPETDLTDVRRMIDDAEHAHGP